ncbi:copper resistance CopC/CopD family protein [Alicyclobacillus dauci]|uniref:Copper resistance protein CopC n=1 Tax=Alicyclobacillus dauci TaxID=1475485 RepID=A0ABY6Z0N1_9BACL|nr:copper resistance protein CopC [Alicyclobacillus dauci]WAH36428.1 copper resistance protein CopC [Alicyclobacillus dauci]
MAMVSLPMVASAHAYVVQSSPTVSQSLSNAPSIIEVRFDENVQLVPDGLTVTDEDNHRVDLQDAKLDPQDHNEIKCRVPSNLPKGIYTIHWQVISADGHMVQGTIPFGIKVDVNSLHLGATETGYTPGPSMLLDRCSEYLGLALIIGVVVFFRFLWPISTAAGLRGIQRWVIGLGWALMTVGVAFSLPIQAAITWSVHGFTSFSPRYLLRTLNFTLFGYLWVIQMLLLLIVPPVIAVLMSPRIRNRWWWIVSPGFLIPITIGLTGHAVAESNPTLPVFAVIIHIYAASIWVGGIIASLVLINMSLRKPELFGHSEVLHSIRRFSIVAVSSVILLGLTGFYAAFLHIPTWYALFRTEYGQTLLVKLLLFGAMLLLAAIHWAKRTKVTVSLRTFVAAEFVVSLAVFVATALLTNLPTGQNNPGPVHKTRLISDEKITLSITPSHVGENQFTVSVTDNKGKPLGTIQQVTLEFSSASVPQGAENLRLTRERLGVYSGKGLNLSGGGRWNVTVDILTNSFTDLNVTFPISVGQ